MKGIKGKIKSYPVADLKAVVEGDERRISGMANTTAVDRYKEVVEAKAFEGTLGLFGKNPIMLYMHDARTPVGKFDKLEIRDNGLWVSGTVGKGFKAADEAWAMIEQGILKAFSIGFLEKKGALDREKGIWHILELELLEVSIVSVPANQEALFEMEDGKCTGVTLIDPEQSQSSYDLAIAAEGKALAAEQKSAEPEAVWSDFSALTDAALLQVVQAQAAVIEEQKATISDLQERLGDVEICLSNLMDIEAQRLADEGMTLDDLEDDSPENHTKDAAETAGKSKSADSGDDKDDDEDFDFEDEDDIEINNDDGLDDDYDGLDDDE